MRNVRFARKWLLALAAAVGLAGTPAALADGLLVGKFFPLELADTSVDCS